MSRIEINEYKTQMRSGKIGHAVDKREYFQELNYLSKIYNLPMHKINILDETVDGELWIWFNDTWNGDLDQWFYECMARDASYSEYMMQDTE